MQFDKPNTLALILAFLITVLTMAAVLILSAFQVLPLPTLYTLGLAVFLFLISFFFVRLGIENFIYNKVKIIYKNIHDLKVGSGLSDSEMVHTNDLDLVTREVSEWANQRRDEIEELRERENFRREFIGNISHELKTPIFNIQGYMLTLLDGALDDPEINRKYLKRANKSVDRMINIIEDLEIISDLEANRIQLNEDTFDLVQLVRDVFELLEDQSKKRKIRLKLQKEYEKPIRVVGDQTKIEQVLINLISNAIKYGREKGTVEVAFFDMDKRVLTEINDDGVGIPEEDLPRVFERFYRVDKSRSREAGGTGLGLSIVKHIMEVHRQSINVRSTEDQGSTFSFTLEKSK